MGQVGIISLISDAISFFCCGVNPTTDVRRFKIEIAPEHEITVDKKRGTIQLPQDIIYLSDFNPTIIFKCPFCNISNAFFN